VSSLGKKIGFQMAIKILEEMQTKISSGEYALAENLANMDVNEDDNNVDTDDDHNDDNNNAIMSLINSMIYL
jgi:hypothetical protein